MRKVFKRKKPPSVATSCYCGGDGRCGDSCGWDALPDGRFAVAVSDGMGKGDFAARESKRAVDSVLALLKAGMDPEMALHVLNLLWSQGNRKEHFPTMDLSILDPESRELFIYKTGAAPTLIMRTTGKSEILTAPAMPMGVVEHTDISCVGTLVSAGDKIIMMTDGIADSCQAGEELQWLHRLLTRIKSQNLQTVSDLIIREAAMNYGDREKDDMTAVVIRM